MLLKNVFRYNMYITFIKCYKNVMCLLGGHISRQQNTFDRSDVEVVVGWTIVSQMSIDRGDGDVS